MKKKVLSLALALVMVLAMAIPAFAGEIIQTLTPASDDTTMTYEVASIYTVTIPDTITIGTNKAGSITLGVNEGALIAHQESILIKLTTCDLELINGDDSLTYTITDDADGTVEEGATVLTHAAGNLAASSEVLNITVVDSAKYSGDYEDTVTFTVSILAPQA